MSEEKLERRATDNRGLERHLSSIGVAITILVLGWVSTSIMSQTESIAVLGLEIKHVKEMIVNNSHDKYTGSQAASNIIMANMKFESIERRLAKLEKGNIQ